MNEFYMEQLVPRKKPVKKDSLIKNICLALTAVMVVLTVLLGGIFLVGVMVLGVIDVMLLKNSSVEYEYLYLNGELDIDKVIAKQKRKKAYTLDMKDVVVIATVESGEVRPFQSVKTSDFSSGVMSPSVYKAVISKNGEKTAILFEPNEDLLKGMKMVAPRKVFI